MALAVLSVLSACGTADPYASPVFPFGPGYQAARAAKLGAPVLLGNDDWWLRLGDPVLNQLMTAAMRGSLSLDAARARVTEARAGVAGIAPAASLQSSVGLSVEGTQGTEPVTTAPANLGFGWMLDPYGARRAERAAAGGRLEMAEAEVQAAQLLLLFNMGNAYVDLRYRQRILALREQERRGRQQTLAMARTLQESLAATRLDVLRSEARVAEIDAALPALRAGIATKMNEIAVLTGVAPGSLGIDLNVNGGQPRPDLTPDVGIPADLLRNRPDIRIAERDYYVAVAELGQARAAQYPRLSLTGAITLTGLTGGGLTREAAFGPSLQFPTLPGTAARAGVDAGHARVEQAHARWRSAVLAALLEVENALLDYRAASGARQSADRAATLYREALGLSRDVFEQGDATLGDLIDAEQALAAADQARAETLYRQGLSFVALNVRLGAGHAVTAR